MNLLTPVDHVMYTRARARCQEEAHRVTTMRRMNVCVASYAVRVL